MSSATALYARSLRRSLPETLEVTAAVLAGQLAIGWHNDALDAERDRAGGRLDKPAARGEIAPRSLTVAAVAAGVACVPLSLRLGHRAGGAHLAAVTAGLAYNLGLRATAASIVPYLAAFGLLPAVVHLSGAEPLPPPAWVVGAAALLGGGAHVANVLPDLEADTAQGIVGLPHRLGRRASLATMASLLLGATCLLAVGTPGPARLRAALAGASASTALAAVALGALGSPQRLGRSRAAFRLVCAGAVADVGWLLAAARATAAPGSRRR